MPLDFQPNHCLPGMFVAKANGCSIIHGYLIEGYEVDNGAIHQHLTLEQAEELVNAGYQGD